MHKVHQDFPPRHVLITQLSTVRDIVMAIPLAVDVKRLWPDCQLSWLVECPAAGLLEQHACIDQVITIDRGWLRRPGSWKGLRQQLREQAVDLVIDPHGLTKSALLGWLSGARVRVGFDAQRGRELAPWLATRRVAATMRHRVDVYRELLSPWQPPQPQQAEYAMPLFAEAATSVEAYLDNQEPLQTGQWLAIHPGAVWPTALWPVERFGAVARQLHTKYELPAVVLWTDEHERLLAQVVAENSNGAARVAPPMTLPEISEALRRCHLLLAGDAEPLQLASALRTPCVSLHGPTWADEVGPYGNTSWAIQSPIPNLSKRMNRRGPNTAMVAIEIDEVLYHCERLLSRLQRMPAQNSAA